MEPSLVCGSHPDGAQAAAQQAPGALLRPGQVLGQSASAVPSLQAAVSYHQKSRVCVCQVQSRLEHTARADTTATILSRWVHGQGVLHKCKQVRQYMYSCMHSITYWQQEAPLDPQAVSPGVAAGLAWLGRLLSHLNAVHSICYRG